MRQTMKAAKKSPNAPAPSPPEPRLKPEEMQALSNAVQAVNFAGMQLEAAKQARENAELKHALLVGEISRLHGVDFREVPVNPDGTYTKPEKK